MSKKEPEKSTPDPRILQSIEVRPIKREERAQWDALVRHHHYLGLHSLIGESIRYLAIHHERWLALIGWSAAALKVQGTRPMGRVAFFHENETPRMCCQ